MQEKILSIIIPSYNMEKYISKCLDSLLIPEINMLDILVINDGSKDRTSEISHKYEKKYPGSIRVIDKENGNYGSCINRGLKEAKGKYVKVLDADDSFDTFNFSRFINSIINIDVDCIITDYTRVNQSQEPIRRIIYDGIPNEKLLKLEDIEVVILKKLAMHAITYRTSLLHELKYHQSEGISYTDIEWIYTPIAAAKKYIYIPINVYLYLVGRGGQTVDAKVSAMHTNDTIIGIKKQTHLLESSNDNTLNKKYLKHKLAKRILRLYTNILIWSVGNRELLKNLDYEYKDKWKKQGIDIDEISKLPLLRKSFIREWRDNDYDLNYSFSNLYKLRIYRDIILSKIYPFYKPPYLSI